MKDAQCNIRMTEEFLYALQDQADFEGISVSEYVRVKLAGVMARQRKSGKNTPSIKIKQCIASVPRQ